MRYKVLATHVNRTPEDWELLVAIESSPGYYKAYFRLLTTYPGWSDVMSTATSGHKLSPEAARKAFTETSQTHKYEY